MAGKKLKVTSRELDPFHLVFTGDIDIFVPKEKEKAYLDEHMLDVRRLSNGAYILGATREVSDRSSADIVITFPSGAYFEPKKKSGINHLIEHMISKDSMILARKVDAYYNASTSAGDMQFDIRGTANSDVRSYGVWPIIESVGKQLTKISHFSEEHLKSEKGVVFGEMHEAEANFNRRAWEILNEIVLTSDNPFNYRVLGTRKDVENISLDDTFSQMKALFIPQMMSVKVFVEGSPQTTQIILDQMEKLFSPLQSTKKPGAVSLDRYGDLSASFSVGKTFMQHSEVAHNIIQVNYVWVVSSEYYTIASFTQSRFFELASQKFTSFFRESGLGYISNVINRGLGSTSRMVGFSMNIPKRPDYQEFIKNLFPLIRDRVIGSFNDEDIAYITDLTHKRLTAVPITAFDRFSDLITGLRYYEKIIDAERVLSLNQKITEKGLKDVMNTFMTVEPATIIIGDLE